MIMASLGVMVKRTSLLGTTSQYYEICHIEDIVIVEAISMVKYFLFFINGLCVFCCCFLLLLILFCMTVKNVKSIWSEKNQTYLQFI